MIVLSRIPWSEVVNNFSAVKKAPTKTPVQGVSSTIPGNVPVPTASTPLPPEEPRQIFTPKVKRVTRKRPYVLRKDREKRMQSDERRGKVEKEDAYYLKINTENLQKLKDDLESIKLRMKEMKEKKMKKEKNRKK
jgi:hypothetical protein